MDPGGFIEQAQGLTVFDEIQQVPQLFPVLKNAVDNDRRPGRFLLTGSANVLVLPRLSESLAGRMELITLEGLSQGELLARTGNLIDGLFGEAPPELRHMEFVREGLLTAMLAGGYPEACQRLPGRRRSQWYDSYVQTLLHRDVQELSRIEGISILPRLLEFLAIRSASLLNLSELSRTLGLPLNTLKRYLGLLEALYLTVTVQPWSSHLGKRLVKSPKLYLRDAGLMGHLLGAQVDRLLRTPDLVGGLLETFVVGEVRKLLGWSTTRARLFHYRTQEGHEVDLVLERADGGVVGLEVKASGSLQGKDFRGLQKLSETLGDGFLRGVVLYTGSEVVPFGPKLWAMPVPVLWDNV